MCTESSLDFLVYYSRRMIASTFPRKQHTLLGLVVVPGNAAQSWERTSGAKSRILLTTFKPRTDETVFGHICHVSDRRNNAKQSLNMSRVFTCSTRDDMNTEPVSFGFWQRRGRSHEAQSNTAYAISTCLNYHTIPTIVHINKDVFEEYRCNARLNGTMISSK